MRRCRGRLPVTLRDIRVAAAGGVLALACGLAHLGSLPCPRRQVPGSREHGHVRADLADQVLRGDDPEPGDTRNGDGLQR